jgi:5'-methylthioadenosine phosphorylase
MEDKLVGIIGGTGLEDSLAAHLSQIETVKIDTPFGKPSSAITVGTISGRLVAVLNRHGPGHRVAPSEVPYRANIFALKKLGVRTVVGSGAVGSLRQEIEPGHLVLVDQFIDKTHKRQSTFFDGFGAVHCEFAEPTCEKLRAALHKAARKTGLDTHPGGTYICMEGPQFSSRAESLMHRGWGGDLIGMTALPEAKLAREAQMCYALIALASDYDCWRQHETSADKKTLLQEIISNLKTATDNCLKLLVAALKSDELLVFEDCPCRRSLELAVWTSNDQIDAAARERLSVLFE